MVLAWGVHAARLKRPAEVLELLGRMGVKPHCLRLTASGHPEQPAEATAGGRSGEIPRPSGKSGNTGHPSPLTQGGKTYRNMLSFWVCIEGDPQQETSLFPLRPLLTSPARQQRDDAGNTWTR